jgi:hypothetical protein
MRNLVRTVCVVGMLIVSSYALHEQKTESSASGPTSMVITFKDGHQETFLMSDIARVQYVGASDAILGMDYFLGRWEVGSGSSDGTFQITLESNGEASKTLGASHGIWTIEANEARINWDDGWHDAIRKVGTRHEKLAFEPGTTFSDKPNNVTAARKLSNSTLPKGDAAAQ